jgi:hypothetical protein
LTVRFNMPRPSAFDANGTPRSGARLYFYEPTTLTPKDVYSDSGLTTPIVQPVVASSAGLWATMFMQASLYRVILKDSSDVTIWDEDNFDPGLAAGFGVSSVVGVSQGGTGANNAASARANLGAASSDAVTAIQNTQTTQTTLINTGLHTDGDRFGALAAEDEVTRDLLVADFGTIELQEVSSTTVSDSSVTTTTPAFDTSIPQVGEGEQIMSLAITPLVSGSKVKVRVDLTFTVSTTPMNVVFAMFRNGAASAVVADGGQFQQTQGQISLYYEETTASTSTITYTIRAGVSTGTLTIPGTNNLGGTRVCRIEAIEKLEI